MSSPADELVEEVAADGTVLGVVTRAEVRAHRVRHRTVFVAVLDGAGERVLVHRRADWKDVWPGRWDLAFGGICDVGEGWVEAAGRELAEEAGLAAPLVAGGQGAYEDEAVAEVAHGFLARSDDEPTSPDAEVAEVAWVPVAGLRPWVGERDVVPDSLALVLPHLASVPSHMTGLTVALLVLAAPVALVNWVGVARDDRRLVWAAKPTTLVLLVLVALAIDADDPTVRLWFVIGLVLSLAGDVFLMLPEETELPLPPFLLGLASFLLGHIAYVVGMATDLDSWGFVAVGLLVVAAAGGLVAPRIVAGVRTTSPDLVVPVLAYMAVISCMVMASFGRGVALGIVGALLFYASDAILAWNRFVTPSRLLQVAVMVTYHLGQLGLVLSLLG